MLVSSGPQARLSHSDRRRHHVIFLLHRVARPLAASCPRRRLVTPKECGAPPYESTPGHAVVVRGRDAVNVNDVTQADVPARRSPPVIGRAAATMIPGPSQLAARDGQ